MSLPNRVYMPGGHYIDLSISQTLSLGDEARVEGNIVPDTDDNRNLGAPANRFSTVYARALSITDGVVFDNQAPNQILAGPTGAPNAAAAFRSLVAGDLPSHTHAAADVTGTAVVQARTISTTSPLSGGGDLSGDRTIAFSNQSANQVLAGPASGAAAAPSFRALTTADIPETFPSGLIVLSLAACPSGWSEVTALSGKFALGTLEAAGDAGGTGGSNDYTPAGSNSTPTFTGSAANTTSVSAGTPTGEIGTPIGTDQAETGSAVFVARDSHTHTFTGDAMAGHLHSVTATGTVSAPTFSGTPATIQPPFVKLIFCQKD